MAAIGVDRAKQLTDARRVRYRGVVSDDDGRECASKIRGDVALGATRSGSPGWTRTNDQRINSPTLYR
jgi:hypothetical protein